MLLVYVQLAVHQEYRQEISYSSCKIKSDLLISLIIYSLHFITYHSTSGFSF